LEDLKKLESKTGKLPNAAHLNGARLYLFYDSKASKLSTFCTKANKVRILTLRTWQVL
jgi:hypothetical protein